MLLSCLAHQRFSSRSEGAVYEEWVLVGREQENWFQSAHTHTYAPITVHPEWFWQKVSNVGEQTIELGQRHRGVPAVAIVLLTQDTETS